MFVYMPVLHLTLKMYFVKQSKRSSNYSKMFQQLFSDTQMISPFYKDNMQYVTVKLSVL